MQLPSLPAMISTVQPAQDVILADSSFMTQLSINSTIKDGKTVSSGVFTLAACNGKQGVLSSDRKTDFKGKVPDLIGAAEIYPALADVVAGVLTVIPLMAKLQIAKETLAEAQKASDELATGIGESTASQAIHKGQVSQLSANIAAIEASKLTDADKAAHLANLEPQLSSAQASLDADTKNLATLNGQTKATAAQLQTAQTAFSAAETDLGKTS